MSRTLFEQMIEMSNLRRKLQRGACLFYRGDPVTTLFIVEEGGIELIRPQENGAPIVLQRAEGGTVLAEASAYSDAYHCDAVATKPTVVAAVSKRRFLDRLAENKMFSQLWTSHLAREVQTARYRSEIVSRKTVAERLDAWLTWQGTSLPQKGEWKNVAMEIGVSPEALYRELAKRRR